MAIEDVTQRFLRVTAAFDAEHIPYALVGGQAVALWVATREPDAVRTTKDVDILVSRDDLPAVRKAGLSIGMDYFEVMGVGMLLERDNPMIFFWWIRQMEPISPDFKGFDPNPVTESWNAWQWSI